MVYLTVHDLVWLNSLVRGEAAPHDYEILEAGMAAQYGYGDSRDLNGQAAAFAEQMLRRHPFREGSLRTGLLGVSTFLACNGVRLAAGADVVDRVRSVARGAEVGETLIAALVGDTSAPEVEPSSVRRVARETRQALLTAIEAMADEDGPVSGWSASPYLHRD